MRYKPQNAETLKGDYPHGRDLVLEPKYDGARLLAETSGPECGRPAVVDFYTRSDKVHYGNRFPEIERQLLSIFPEGTVLDGELICPANVGGTSTTRIGDWGTVQSVLGSKNLHPDNTKLIYMVFDVLALGGHDARSLPFSKRRELLTKAFAGVEGSRRCIALTAQFEADPRIHEELVSRGWEGSILKDLKAPYRSGKRGYGWWKVKPVSTVDGIITGFQEGKNGFAGMVGAIEFSQPEEPGYLAVRGKVSGFDMKLREDMTKHPENYIGKVIEVTHEGVTKEGKFRFPRFCRLRDDKPASEVTWHDA